MRSPDAERSGLPTVAVMKESGATALSVDAGKTLLFDREELIERADEAGIAIVGVQPSQPALDGPASLGRQGKV